MQLLALAALVAARGPVNFAMHGADWLDGSCVSRTAQSPVDFEALKLPPTHELTYDYRPLTGNLTLASRGHAVELGTGQSMMGGGVKMDGEIFSLLYVDLHSPAEHTVRGVRAPLEIQLYHKAAGNPRLAVLSFLVHSANPPDPTGPLTPYSEPAAADQDFNPDLQPLLTAPLPSTTGTEEVRDAGGLNLLNLFKATVDGPATFWMYDGSMTAPPCAEAVRWFVRREPLLASDAQIRVFDTALRNMTSGQGNYRVVMPWNDRRPLVWRSAQGEVVPSPPASHGRLRSGPQPRTDNELQAVKQAELADKLAKQSVEYVRDVEKRLTRAADAHLENLQGQRKVAEEAGMARSAALRSPPTVEPMPPVVQKHFMPLVRDLAEQAAQKVIAGVRKAAQDAASSVTMPARVEAARQQYVEHMTPATAMTPEQLAKAAAKAAGAA